MNFTAIARSFNLYGQPALLMAAGTFGMLVSSPADVTAVGIEQIVEELKSYVFLACAALAMAGSFWGLWRVWLDYRHSRGDVIGGCDCCGGTMRHLDGRYGAYSKCLMCGSTQKGWH